MRATTPLLPCLPAILSPSVIFRVCAIHTRTSLLTPGFSSSSSPRLTSFVAITFPPCPCLTLKEVSLTSRAFSPKIARSNFSSALSSVSPFGVIFPTKISPASTSAPILTIPSSSRFLSADSLTFGMSCVISSGPNFVSRASTSYFSICREVNLSSRIMRSLKTMASSKLYPSQVMNAARTFCPKASCP